MRELYSTDEAIVNEREREREKEREREREKQGSSLVCSKQSRNSL